MSKRDPQDLKHMLSKIGVTKDAGDVLRNNSNIFSKLSTVIKEAGVSKCPNSVGELIYQVHVKGLNIAKASANELKSFRKRIKDKITTSRKAP